MTTTHTGKHTVTVSAVVYPGKPEQFVIICEECGQRIGQPQQFEGDAEAIAERHAELGGFEPRG